MFVNYACLLIHKTSIPLPLVGQGIYKESKNI